MASPFNWPTVALALTLFFALGACAETGGGNSVQSGLAEAFNDARHDPARRAESVQRCTFIFLRAENDPGFDEMIAALFDVPVPQAQGAYCAAMVEASISNDFTETDLERLQVPRAQRGMEPFGKMLRKALVAHERLRAQQAQRPPQAQSCGCGQ